MIKFLKKHYMPILATTIFVSVFFYQFFNLAQISYIQQYSLQGINYLGLLSYTVVVLVVVSIMYNVPLLLTIKISQSIRIPLVRIPISHQRYIVQLVSTIFIVNRNKLYNVFRC